MNKYNFRIICCKDTTFFLIYEKKIVILQEIDGVKRLGRSDERIELILK